VAVDDVPDALTRLADAGIGVADGASFGAPGLLRLAATTDDALIRALELLAAPTAAERGLPQ
jgi:aspartate/methionine/tyrosine aminotransferase